MFGTRNVRQPCRLGEETAKVEEAGRVQSLAYVGGPGPRPERGIPMSKEVDWAPKPIDPDFMNKPDEYPETGAHFEHKVFAEGKQRLDANGKTNPTSVGIHGLHVAVDFDACIADGVCMDVCPVDVFEWELNPGKKGTGNDIGVLEPSSEQWVTWRTDKSDPIRESDCIDCMACEVACPTKCIKISP